MNELITKWKNGETAIYRFTTKGDAITAKMIFENHCRDEIEDIKILEQEPCDDCISREAVEKLKKYRFSYDTNTTIPKSDVFVKISDIADLPSIALQRPKGHWIPIHPLQEDDEGAYMCSCCRVGDWGIDPKVDKCCFNCGADMGGGEE